MKSILKKLSLKSQLIIALLIPLVSTRVISASLNYRNAKNLTSEISDYMLRDLLTGWDSFIQEENGRWVVHIPSAVFQLLEKGYKEKFYFQVSNSRGEILAGQSIIPMPEVRTEGYSFRHGAFDSNEVRIGTLVITKNGAQSQEVFTIQIARTLNDIDDIFDESMSYFVMFQLIMGTVVIVIVGTVMTVGFRPFARVQASIKRFSLQNLQSIAVDDAPREIKPLLTTINTLLSRIKDDISTQQRFFENASHQFKTPLAGLKNLLELSRTKNNNPEISAFLDQMSSSVNRMSRSYSSLLTYSRLTTSEQRYGAFDLVDLREICKEVIIDMYKFAESKKIDLGFGEVCAHNTFVKGNKLSLIELVSNLVDNAIRYTPEGGEITVDLKQEQGLTLTVTDSGRGIPESMREQVFERFFRIPSEQEGTGLGLSIVKEVADQHGATVEVRQTHNAKGSCFAVMFPVYDDQPQKLLSSPNPYKKITS